MRDINQLHPRLIEKVYQLMELCQANGITIGIGECVRTVAEQDALYAQGRTTAGKVVTNAKGSTYSSMHQWGVAFDFYLKMDIDGDGSITDDAFNDATNMFSKVGALGKSIGLEWGGDWKSIVDKPHFQLPDWGSTASKLKSEYGTPDKFRLSWPSANTEDPTPSPSVSAGTPGSTGSAIVIASSGLIVRAEMSTSSNRLTAIPYKKSCEVLVLNAGTNGGLTWAKVTYGGKTGYVAQKYLNVTKAPSAATNTATSATGQNAVDGSYSKNVVDCAKSKDVSLAGKYQTSANLNLRYGAAVSKDIILTIPKGDKVEMYGFFTTNGGTPWFLVQYGKYTGFCSESYLKKVQ